MGDIAVTLVAGALAVTLMFVVPLMTMANKTDDVTATAVQTETTDYTTTIRTTGQITQQGYDNFVLALSATGNAYEPEITIQKLDINPAKKTVGESSAIGGTGVLYYTMYQTQVMDELEKGNGIITLSEGDIVTVKVNLVSKTIADQLRGAVYKLTGKEGASTIAEDSGIVTKSKD